VNPDPPAHKANPARRGRKETRVTLDLQELRGLKATLDQQEREALQELKALRATRALLDRLVPMDLLDPKAQREILETLGLPEPMVQQALTAVRDYKANKVQWDRKDPRVQ
jgi:hypothetical protein